jgi:allophanate hydrolase subunit 2
MTTLEIMRAGPLALVEDLGRAGLAHLGVTRSGAADRIAWWTESRSASTAFTMRTTAR